MLKTYDNMKLDFLFLVEQILAFTSTPNMLREIKNLSTNFQSRHVLRCSVFSLG